VATFVPVVANRPKITFGAKYLDLFVSSTHCSGTRSFFPMRVLTAHQRQESTSQLVRPARRKIQHGGMFSPLLCSAPYANANADARYNALHMNTDATVEALHKGMQRL